MSKPADHDLKRELRFARSMAKTTTKQYQSEVEEMLVPARHCRYIDDDYVRFHIFLHSLYET